MSKPPITHLVIDTSSTDENYNGDCDYALVPMTAVLRGRSPVVHGRGRPVAQGRRQRL